MRTLASVANGGCGQPHVFEPAADVVLDCTHFKQIVVKHHSTKETGQQHQRKLKRISCAPGLGMRGKIVSK